jgi:hypothetical protein
MSTSGTYSYWPKVNNPNAQFVQMTSGEYQPPFFFGGSQIPLAMSMSGNGLQHTQIPGRPKYTIKPIYNDINGKGLDHASLATSLHNDKIYIPKHLSSIHM